MIGLHELPAQGKGNPVVRIAVELSDGTQKIFKGRDAWALNALIDGGMIGLTPLDNPAPRWSHYVFKLRRAGLNVETIDEPHGGAFSGSHARYVLRSVVSVVKTVRQNDRKAASRPTRAQAVAA